MRSKVAVLLAVVVLAAGCQPTAGSQGASPAPAPSEANDGLIDATGDPVACVRDGAEAALPYRCPLLWDSPKSSADLTRIPLYRAFTSQGLSEIAAINHLYREAGAQYFKCHEQGAEYTFAGGFGWPQARHTWWGLTQGDEHSGQWGWVPEVYFLGGADDEPDPGLPLCTDADIALVV